MHAGQLKATKTHTGCVMLVAFSMQQLLHERASVLRSTYGGAGKSLARPTSRCILMVRIFRFSFDASIVIYI